MNYGLTNRVLVRKDVEGQPSAGAPRELLAVSIRQSYYTDERASTFDNSYSYGYNFRAANAFSPIALSARALPSNPLAVDYRLEYDPIPDTDTTPKLLGMSLNGTLRTPTADVSAGWTRQAYSTNARSNNYINAATNLRFSDGKFGGQVVFNYDFARRSLLNQRYVGFYNPQCCGVSVEFQSFNYPSGQGFLLPHDRRFNISFTLAGVGSFSNLLGAFGGGT
jgi:hypothetical protein